MESRARQADLAVVVSSGGTTWVPKGTARDFSSYTRMVAVLSWPGQIIDIAGCLDAIAGAFGPSVASTVVVLPVDRIPLTEQGKPIRPEIRRLGRELADEPSPS
jgi:hypothetical protein